MRCPKCRADMEQVDYEGTEVDRCSRCGGMWFDAGELEVLKNKEAAKGHRHRQCVGREAAEHHR